MFEGAETKVENFLTGLAVKQNVVASTQNQAFNALMFLYVKVLEHPLAGVNVARLCKQLRIPVVLSKAEAAQVLSLIDGIVEGLLLGVAGVRYKKAANHYATNCFILHPINGAPDTIRTCDRLVRSQVLYPAELRALKANIYTEVYDKP